MIIGGLQKTTLIDFPGRVGCTVFLVGCNFRCPFCHNKDLVTFTNFKQSGLQEISEQSFFEFLGKRKKILDGVCITGGEPLINQDLPSFCQKIKNLSLQVKLDTNGSQPERLKNLIEKKLVDFVALDLKTSFENYSKLVKFKVQSEKLPARIALPETAVSLQAGTQSVAGGKITAQNLNIIKQIKTSIRYILQSGLEYEFRTTIVPTIHNPQLMVKLANQVKDLLSTLNFQFSTFNYFLQPFRPQNCLNPSFLKIQPFCLAEVQAILKAVRKILPQTKLRGEEES